MRTRMKVRKEKKRPDRRKQVRMQKRKKTSIEGWKDGPLDTFVLTFFLILS